MKVCVGISDVCCSFNIKLFSFSRNFLLYETLKLFFVRARDPYEWNGSNYFIVYSHISVFTQAPGRRGFIHDLALINAFPFLVPRSQLLGHAALSGLRTLKVRNTFLNYYYYFRSFVCSVLCKMTIITSRNWFQMANGLSFFLFVLIGCSSLWSFPQRQICHASKVIYFQYSC